jgi:predicted ester cyclase
MGIPATGKQIVAKGADVRRIEAGKVAEIWDFPDTLGIMTQLGAIPGRPASK